VIHIKKIEDLLTVGSRIFFQTHFYPLIKMQEKANEIFLSFLSKSGNEIPVLLNVAMHRNGELFEIHCGGMRISQRNRFEKEILEAKHVAEKALLENEELMAMRNELRENKKALELRLKEVSQINEHHHVVNKVLSHDLQEPLRKISLFSSKLEVEYNALLPDEGNRILQKISYSITKIRSLLDGLHRFNSLDEKRLIHTEIDMVQVLADAKELAGIKPEDDITFTTALFPEFFADYKLIVNLFFELICNSVKFRKSEVPLVITIIPEVVMQNIFVEIEDKYHYEQFLRITYTDNGIGFNVNSGNVFHIFRKAHPIPQGDGIGLAYCRKVVELHHGSISVDSAEGKGATFTILLPVHHT
jgi:sigma-B regulation protein RsbU (phosphoserine phosphatase)